MDGSKLTIESLNEVYEKLEKLKPVPSPEFCKAFNLFVIKAIGSLIRHAWEFPDQDECYVFIYESGGKDEYLCSNTNITPPLGILFSSKFSLAKIREWGKLSVLPYARCKFWYDSNGHQYEFPMEVPIKQLGMRFAFGHDMFHYEFKIPDLASIINLA